MGPRYGTRDLYPHLRNRRPKDMKYNQPIPVTVKPVQEDELIALINGQIDQKEQYKNRDWFNNPPQNEKEWAIMENSTGEV